MNIKFTL